jgi:YD repeat-containing protein
VTSTRLGEQAHSVIQPYHRPGGNRHVVFANRHSIYPRTTVNGQGRLQRIQTGTLQDLNYTYDAVGNVWSIVDNKVTGGAQTQSFGYDALDRLTSASATGGSSRQGQYSAGYTYNAIGNLNAQTRTYGTQSGSCPDGALSKPHAVVISGTNTYCYDRQLCV